MIANPPPADETVIIIVHSAANERYKGEKGDFTKNLLEKSRFDNLEIVYKYRDWNNEFHRNILLKNQLFLAPPSKFNDPFDCRIPANYYLLDTDEKRKKYADKIVERHFTHVSSEQQIHERNRIENELLRNIEHVQKENFSLLIDMMDKYYGVLSLSARWDSILMWSHYGNFHEGFCVGLHEESLRSSSLFGQGGLVTYDDNFPMIDPLDGLDFDNPSNIIQTAFKMTHYKAKDWEYEQEYRLTKLFIPDIATSEKRTMIIPDDFFAEVIIGLNTPDKHKNEKLKFVIKKISEYIF